VGSIVRKEVKSQEEEEDLSKVMGNVDDGPSLTK
jgi:hypothetical protein